MDKLIKSITEAQEKRGLNDRQFCLLIGIEPATWSRVKRGMTGLSIDVIKAIAREFPELALAIQDFIFKQSAKDPVNAQ